MWLLPTGACAGVYDSCVLSYDFGNRSSTLIYLTPMGQTCYQKCQTVCAPFIVTGGVGLQVVSNDQAAKCLNFCQRGLPFTGFVYQNSPAPNNAVYAAREITSQITTTQWCQDASGGNLSDLDPSNGVDTGLVMSLGEVVYMSIDTSVGPQAGTYPQPNAGVVFTCGFQEIALEPVMYSTTPADWEDTTPWPQKLNWSGALTRPTPDWWLYSADSCITLGNCAYTQSNIQAMHACLQILTNTGAATDGMTNINNKALWGGYQDSGGVVTDVAANRIWSTPSYVNSTFTNTANNQNNLYNYQNLCGWNARNIYPINTGISVRAGDYLSVKWTMLNDYGYITLGYLPTGSPTTPACLKNKDLYPFYIGNLNQIYNSTYTLPTTMTNANCTKASGTDYVDSAPTGGVPSYSYATDSPINGTDISTMCSNLVSYSPNFPNVSPPQLPDPSTGSTIFTPTLVGSAPINSLKVLLAEGGIIDPNMNYNIDQVNWNGYQDVACNMKTQVCDTSPSNPLLGVNNVSGSFCYDAYHFHVGYGSPANLISGIPIYNDPGHGSISLPSVDWVTPQCASNFRCGMINSTIDPLITGATTTLSSAYPYYRCLGVDMPLIWDASKKQLFVSTAVNNVGTNGAGFQLISALSNIGDILPTRANCGSFTNAYPFQLFNALSGSGYFSSGGDCPATGYYLKPSDAMSYSNGLGKQLFCSSQLDSTHYQYLANVINNNANLMFIVYPYNGTDLVLQNNILYVPTNVYTNQFANATHHWDYVRQIFYLEQSYPIINDNDANTADYSVKPYVNVVNLLANNTVKFPGLITKTACGSTSYAGNPGTTYQGLEGKSTTSTVDFSTNDPLSEWYFRSGLELFGQKINSSTSLTGGPADSTCNVGTAFPFVGALADPIIRSVSLINSSGTPDPAYSNLAPDWVKILSQYGMNITVASNHIPSDNSQATTGLPLSPNPIQDYLFTVSGTIANVSPFTSPQPLIIKHPTPLLNGGSGGNPVPDSKIVWNQLGGTSAYITWGGCPVSWSNNTSTPITFYYKLINAADGTTCISDWTEISLNQLSGGEVAIVAGACSASGAGSCSAAGTPVSVKLYVKMVLNNVTDTTTSCGSYSPNSSTCLNNTYGTVPLRINRIAPITMSADSSSNPFSSLLGVVVNMVYSTMFDPTNGVVSAIYNEITTQDSRLLNIARAMIVLYLCVFSIKFLIGALEKPIEEFIKSLLKIAVILAATSSQSWSFFYTQVYQNIFAASSSLIYQFIAGTLMNYDPDSSFLATSQFQNNPGAIFTFISGGWTVIFSNAFLAKFIGILFTNLMGFAIAIVILISVCIYALCLIKVAFIMIMSYLNIALLVIMAPMFICFSLFETTKDMFRVWWQQLLANLISPALVFVATVMFNFMVIASIIGAMSFTVCPICMIPVGPFCLLKVQAPLIFLHVSNISVMSLFYMPLGTFFSALMMLLFTYCMYVFVDFVNLMTIRIIATGLNPGLLQATQGVDQRFAKWATGQDSGTQQLKHNAEASQASTARTKAAFGSSEMASKTQDVKDRQGQLDAAKSASGLGNASANAEATSKAPEATSSSASSRGSGNNDNGARS
jgi:type IV secretory pathway VirB6-like protein